MKIAEMRRMARGKLQTKTCEQPHEISRIAQILTMCLASLYDNQMYWNAVGSAFGGFVGVIVFFLVRLLIEKICSRPKLIRTYQCASDINKGQADEVDGEIKHHHGKQIADKDALAKIGARNPVWEWTRDRVGSNPFDKGGSIFYGPYATDFTEPGLYSVVFKIRGMGFTKPAEITRDVNLLRLDVNCILPEIVGLPQGIANVGKHEDAARRFVRVSELAKDGWQKFELRIWSNGRGTWEYRAWAFDGSGLSPNNFEGLDQNVEIFFDSVKIKIIKKANLPSV